MDAYIYIYVHGSRGWNGQRYRREAEGKGIREWISAFMNRVGQQEFLYVNYNTATMTTTNIGSNNI